MQRCVKLTFKLSYSFTYFIIFSKKERKITNFSTISMISSSSFPSYSRMTEKNVNVLAFSLQGGVQKSVAGLLSWAPIQFTSFANKSQKKCRLMADSWGSGSRQNPGGSVRECEKSSIARILHQTFTWPFSSVLHLFLWLFKPVSKQNSQVKTSQVVQLADAHLVCKPKALK